MFNGQYESSTPIAAFQFALESLENGENQEDTQRTHLTASVDHFDIEMYVKKNDDSIETLLFHPCNEKDFEIWEDLMLSNSLKE